MKIVKLNEYIDNRGNLVENTQIEVMDNSRHFFVSKSAPGVIRGNHYHKYKQEYFFVIQGRCEIIEEDLKTKKQESLIVSDEDHTLVEIAPNKAHAMINLGKNELILLALVNEPLDHKNPDTYPYKII